MFVLQDKSIQVNNARNLLLSLSTVLLGFLVFPLLFRCRCGFMMFFVNQLLNKLEQKSGVKCCLKLSRVQIEIISKLSLSTEVYQAKKTEL